MSSRPRPDERAQRAGRWAPDLGAARLVGSDRTVAMLRRDATVQWWCAPDFDDAPLCWQLLDPDGGAASFSLAFVDAGAAPAGASARTLLRGTTGLVEVWDGLLDAGSGVGLVRLLRPYRPRGRPGPGHETVEHVLRLGGFAASWVTFQVNGVVAAGNHLTGGLDRPVRVHADRHEVRDGVLYSTVRLTPGRWAALVVAVAGDLEPDADALAERLESRDAAEHDRLASCWLPRLHPERALDALAVLRACTYRPSGAVVASPTTSLPEAPGHDRQFDYRYTWLRDASVSTAVAALLGQPEDARRYLDLVHQAWGDRELIDNPVLDVRGGRLPELYEVSGVSGWAASRPVRVGNAAGQQRQYDSLGLLVEAISVYLQVGGRLDAKTWQLVTRLADGVVDDGPDQIKDSNGIWEFGQAQPLVDGDIGRWLVLDRALWIARGWRPWTRRRRWKTARDIIGERILASLDDQGLLPQSLPRRCPHAGRLSADDGGVRAARPRRPPGRPARRRPARSTRRWALPVSLPTQRRWFFGHRGCIPAGVIPGRDCPGKAGPGAGGGRAARPAVPPCPRLAPPGRACVTANAAPAHEEIWALKSRAAPSPH